MPPRSSSSIMAFIWIAIVLFAVKFTEGREKCCPELGCFNMDNPWCSLTRPIPEPDCSNIVVIKLLLYTRTNRKEGEVMAIWPNITMNSSSYDGKKKTVMFIHGWTSSAFYEAQYIKDALLEARDYNVILPDYSSVSNRNYLQAVSDSRVIGRIIARFYRYLQQKHEADPSRLHIIGHSLGAHIAGYAAREIHNVSRVTGLDPAGPLYGGYPSIVRLNKYDARFVEVGHTDAGFLIPFTGYGIIEPIGDVDFYFNGGWSQPGCRKVMASEILRDLSKLDFEALFSLSDKLICPHARVLFYFVEALKNCNNCTFWGITRKLEKKFLNTHSQAWLLEKLGKEMSSCTLETCTPWGLNAVYYPARGSFDVGTSDAEPFCIPRPDVDAKMEHLLQDYMESNTVGE